MIVVKILRMEAVVEDSMMLIPTAFSRHSLVEEWEVWAEWVAIWEVILSSFLVPLVMVRASASNLAKKNPMLGDMFGVMLLYKLRIRLKNCH